MNRFTRFALGMFLLLGTGFFLSSNVIADGADGDGSSGVAGNGDGCKESKRFSTTICNDKSGGASWHIYKTSNPPKVGTSGYPNGNTKPFYKTNLNAFENDEYDRKIPNKCSADKANYYAIYAINGWHREEAGGKKITLPVNFGPLAWKVKVHTKEGDFKFHYNNYYIDDNRKAKSNKTHKEVMDALGKGTNVNGWGVTSGAAETWWKFYNGGQIPKKTGYFCIYFGYKGRVTVKNGEDKSSTNYKKESATAPTLTINNCPESGCTAKFIHDLDKLDTGGKNVKYTIKRDNGSDITGTADVSTSAARVFEEDVVLKPNDKVCQTLIFQPALGNSKTISLKACAVAKKDGNPPGGGPNNSECNTLLKRVSGEVVTGTWAKNVSVSGQDTWKNTDENPIWAKPTDLINWMNCYDSDIGVRSDDTSTDSNSYPKPNPLPGNLYTLDNKGVGDWLSWENSWGVVQQYMTAINGLPRKTYTPLFASVKDEYPNVYTVKTGQEGVTLREISETGYPTKLNIKTAETATTWACNHHSQDCGYCGSKCVEWGEAPKDKDGKVTGEAPCTRSVCLSCDEKCSYTNTPYYTSSEGSRTSTAIVKIPYNFQNWVEMEENSIGDDDDNDREVVYAGETVPEKFTIYTDVDDNELTGGTYATKSPHTKYQIVVTDDYTNQEYLGDVVGDFTVNGGSLMEGDSLTLQQTVAVPDLPAGTTMCVSVQVYPNQVSDSNMTGEGDNESEWVRSENENCHVIAKKPSLQAWGGNVFSQNMISTALANKNNLLNIDYYHPSSLSTIRLFGSWGELGVFSNGKITGFASGASLGYENGSSPAFQNWNWSPLLNPTGAVGGSTTNIGDVCRRNRLTFSNADAFSKRCNSSSIGGMRSTSNVSKIQNDKSSIINILASSSSANMISGDSNTINGLTTNEPYVVQMYKYNNTLTINGDVIYDGNYDSFEKIPKIVFYAKNIDISCNVNRIDALVIAENVVDTCYESYDANDEARARQLRVNGAIITSQLDAKRTYGAGPGVNSGVAAEIIDFDPALYSFGGGLTDTETDNVAGRLDVSSIHELAPRK